MVSVLEPVCLGFLGAFGLQLWNLLKAKKKTPGSQKSEAPQSEFLGFWLVGAFWFF